MCCRPIFGVFWPKRGWGSPKIPFSPFSVFWAKNMDIFGIFKNHVMSRFDISSWSRAMKLLKTFLDSPRVGWNKNNRFETSKVFADMRHTSHMRQKWENQKMKIIKFSNLCLVSANTFDVSNRLFYFIRPLGYLKKVL